MRKAGGGTFTPEPPYAVLGTSDPWTSADVIEKLPVDGSPSYKLNFRSSDVQIPISIHDCNVGPAFQRTASPKRAFPALNAALTLFAPRPDITKKLRRVSIPANDR
jgi:hypothetical protein